VFTHDCTCLAAFKQDLITGNGKTYESEKYPGGSRHRQDTVVIAEFDNGDSNEFLQHIISRVKNAFLDAHVDITLSDVSSQSIVFHNPFNKNEITGLNNLQLPELSSALKNAIGKNLEHVEIVEGIFRDALDRSISLLQETNSDYVALVSPFIYAGQDPDQTNFLGIGCILFSGKYEASQPYANLLWEKARGRYQENNGPNFEESSDSNIENVHDEIYAYYQFAPIIELIKSALELNYKTRFSICRDYLDNSESIDKNSRDLIRPWFPPLYAEKRENVVCLQNSVKITVEENQQSKQHPDKPFSNFGFFLLPVSIDDAESGNQKIKDNISNVSECQDLAGFINQSLNDYQEQKTRKSTLVVLGASRKDLINELERAQSGIVKSLDTGKDWQTPGGSYYTPNPLGPNEKIAFVYPGAFSTYVGMGNEIFFLFPQLYDKFQAITTNPATAINESVVFPPTSSPGELGQLQNELNNNPIQMISSGVCFSFLYTVILRDIFGVNPDCAFGYSLGENSMMFGMGIWKQADAMRTSLEVSPIFHSRVSGPQTAIRDYWKISPDNVESDGSSLWANYVLMATPDKVKNAIKEGDRVYITHINTPRQVVIGGEKNACQRVTDSIKCMHLQTPYNHAIHCDPIASEFDGFVHLNDWPVEKKHVIPVFSAANYAALEYESKLIAKSFAKMLTNPIDFPKLVNLAYEEGARIFIELGAGSNCSKWVDAILKGKPHAAMSINQINVSDHVSILRLIARLISHQVPLNLNPIRRF